MHDNQRHFSQALATHHAQVETLHSNDVGRALLVEQPLLVAHAEVAVCKEQQQQQAKYKNFWHTVCPLVTEQAQGCTYG